MIKFVSRIFANAANVADSARGQTVMMMDVVAAQAKVVASCSR